jgi:hypothetical protein
MVQLDVDRLTLLSLIFEQVSSDPNIKARILPSHFRVKKKTHRIEAENI